MLRKTRITARGVTDPGENPAKLLSARHQVWDSLREAIENSRIVKNK